MTQPMVAGPAIDLEAVQKNELYTVGQLARSIGVCHLTIRNWIHEGRVSRDRSVRVRLQSLVTGKGYVTTKRAYFDFIDLVNGKKVVDHAFVLLESQQPNYLIIDDQVFWRVNIGDIKWIQSLLPPGDILKAEIEEIVKSHRDNQ